jgi:hypothetical protein
MAEPRSPAEVLIVGGGVAALETLMALRDLAGDRAGDDAVAAQPLWWPPTKIAGRYLAPYLYEREPAAAPGPAPEGFADLEVPLETIDATAVAR